jgi:lysophospholipase L1-like esterase
MRRLFACAAAAAALLLGLALPAPAAAWHPGPLPSATHVDAQWRIMPLGDSITAGSMSSTGDGYRADLAAQLAAVPTLWWSYVGSLVSGTAGYHHEGHSGWTISQLAAHVPGWLTAPAPQGLPATIVLWDAGTNDARNGRSGANILADTSAVLDSILAWSPTVRIVVAALTLTLADPAAAAAELDFDTGLPALLTAKGWRVSLANMTGVHLSGDGIHPDDPGYLDMAGRWDAALAPWLSTS